MEVLFVAVAIDGNDCSIEIKLLVSYPFWLWVTHSNEGIACSYSSQHCERQHSAHEDCSSIIFYAVLAFPWTETLYKNKGDPTPGCDISFPYTFNNH